MLRNSGIKRKAPNDETRGVTKKATSGSSAWREGPAGHSRPAATTRESLEAPSGSEGGGDDDSIDGSDEEGEEGSEEESEEGSDEDSQEGSEEETENGSDGEEEEDSDDEESDTEYKDEFTKLSAQAEKMKTKVLTREQRLAHKLRQKLVELDSVRGDWALHSPDVLRIFKERDESWWIEYKLVIEKDEDRNAHSSALLHTPYREESHTYCSVPRYASLEEHQHKFSLANDMIDDGYITFLGAGYLKLRVPATMIGGRRADGDVTFYGVLGRTEEEKERDLDFDMEQSFLRTSYKNPFGL